MMKTATLSKPKKEKSAIEKALNALDFLSNRLKKASKKK